MREFFTKKKNSIFFKDYISKIRISKRKNLIKSFCEKKKTKKSILRVAADISSMP